MVFQANVIDAEIIKKLSGPSEKVPPPNLRDLIGPKDKGYFVLIILWLFGLIQFLPTIFIWNANEYWMYKYRNATSNSTDPNERTYLQANYYPLSNMIVSIPNVMSFFLVTMGGHKFRSETRVFTLLFGYLAVFLSLSVFVTVDTDEWQMMFFVIVTILQVLMTCSMAFGKSGAMSLIAQFPPRYLKAEIIGQSSSYLCSAILRIVCNFITSSVTTSALMFFLFGSMITLITTVLFYFASKTEFFRHYTLKSIEKSEKQVKLEIEDKQEKQEIHSWSDLKEIFKILWPVILVYVLPYANPYFNIGGLVVSEFHGTESIWSSKYFVATCTFLIPALAGLAGRIIYSYADFDCSIPVLYLLTVFRELTCGTLIFLSNAKPRRHLPVIINHDWQYAIVSAFDGFSISFMINLCVVKISRMSPPDRIELGLMCTALISSIFSALTSPIGLWGVSLL